MKIHQKNLFCGGGRVIITYICVLREIYWEYVLVPGMIPFLQYRLQPQLLYTLIAFIEVTVSQSTIQGEKLLT